MESSTSTVVPATLLSNGKKHPTYISWSRMKQRVKRGYFDMDPRWNSYSTFYEEMGERPPNTTLDRIDNTRGYWYNNCRWATHLEQQRNRSNTPLYLFHGEILSSAQVAERLGLCLVQFNKRVRLYGKYNPLTFADKETVWKVAMRKRSR